MVALCSSIKMLITILPDFVLFLCLKAGELFVSTVAGRISTGTDAIKEVQNTDLVIEAIVENIGIKQKLFKSLDEAAPK